MLNALIYELSLLFKNNLKNQSIDLNIIKMCVFIKYLILLTLISIITFSVDAAASSRVHRIGDYPVKSNEKNYRYHYKTYSTSSSCNCFNYTCSCCSHIEFPKLRLNDTSLFSILFCSFFKYIKIKKFIGFFDRLC